MSSPGNLYSIFCLCELDYSSGLSGIAKAGKLKTIFPRLLYNQEAGGPAWWKSSKRSSSVTFVSRLRTKSCGPPAPPPPCQRILLNENQM
ncbi:hypothetical protein VULLAG_LOCUS18927 [Vulpes lagopus]